MITLNEEVKAWCVEFSKEIFETDSIKTNKVQDLAESYIVLRKKYSQCDTTPLIKTELLKSKDGFSFFGGDFVVFENQVSKLFDAADNESIELSSSINAFKKDIIKGALLKDSSKINKINIGSSNILYDLGVADWNYVLGFFKNKMESSQLKDAIGWITAFIDSGDYSADELLVKNEDGKIKKDDTFLNILNEINKKSLTHKPPFKMREYGVLYNCYHKEPISIKLWNEKEQTVYGVAATRMRDYSENSKLFKNWLYLVKENVLVSKIKKIRNEDEVSAGRVKDYINMRLYKELSEDMLTKSGAEPHYLNDELSTSMLIIKSFVKEELNKDIFKNNYEISIADTSIIKNDILKNKNILNFFGETLNKNKANQEVNKALFKKAYPYTLRRSGDFSISLDASKDVLSSIDFKFNTASATEDKKAQIFLYDFLTKDSKEIEELIISLSEKSVYREERFVFFENLAYLFSEMTNNIKKGNSLEESLDFYFSDLDGAEKNKLAKVVGSEDFFKELEKKINQIMQSQHESSVSKDIMFENARELTHLFNSQGIASYLKSEKSSETLIYYKELKEWSERFASDVLGEDSDINITEVLLDEYAVLKEKSELKEDVGKIMLNLLRSNENVMNYFKTEELAIQNLNNLFKSMDELQFNPDGGKSLIEDFKEKKEPSFLVNKTSNFKKKEKEFSSWSFISSYFKGKNSTIKEANGWVLGYLKYGNYNPEKLFKSGNSEKSFNSLLKSINKDALTKDDPFILKGDKMLYKEAKAGDVDVEFWNDAQKKICGMSVTRHTGVKIEGNQFLRHALKIFTKAILLEKKNISKDQNAVKNFRVKLSDENLFLNKSHINNKIYKEIDAGNDMSKNLSIAREYIKEKYGINFHASGHQVGENEMEILVDEMNQKINFLFFGEIRGKSSYPELNAGLLDIAYTENLRNIGNFSISSDASEKFMSFVKTYYNGVSDEAQCDVIAKKSLYSMMFEKSSLSVKLAEYFSEPNAYKEERESLFQGINAFTEKVREYYIINDRDSIEKGVGAFFKDNIDKTNLDNIVDSILNGDFSKNVEDFLSKVKFSSSEETNRFELVIKKAKNLECLIMKGQEFGEPIINESNCLERRKKIKNA